MMRNQWHYYQDNQTAISPKPFSSRTILSRSGHELWESLLAFSESLLWLWWLSLLSCCPWGSNGGPIRQGLIPHCSDLYWPLPTRHHPETCKWVVIIMKKNLTTPRVSLHPHPVVQTFTHSWIGHCNIHLMIAFIIWLLWLLLPFTLTSPTRDLPHAMLPSQWGPGSAHPSRPLTRENSRACLLGIQDSSWTPRPCWISCSSLLPPLRTPPITSYFIVRV